MTDPAEAFLDAVQRGEYAGAPAKDPATMQEAERAGYRRGLREAARLCRERAGGRMTWPR